jgi:hypothetical protein
MNNIRQPAEPNPEAVERAIVELLEIAQRQGISPADFIQLLDSGMHVSDFLAAMTTRYCWVHEACLFARMEDRNCIIALRR